MRTIKSANKAPFLLKHERKKERKTKQQTKQNHHKTKNKAIAIVNILEWSQLHSYSLN